MTLIDRKITYADEWEWNETKERYVNLMTDEELTEKEFDKKYFMVG